MRIGLLSDVQGNLAGLREEEARAAREHGMPLWRPSTRLDGQPVDGEARA